MPYLVFNRRGLLLASALLMTGSVSAVTLTNPNFDTDTSGWSGNIMTQRDITYANSTHKMGCISNPTVAKPDGTVAGLVTVTSFGPLKANTKYQLKFLAVSNNTAGKLVDVRASVREAYDASSNYRARPYVEQVMPANGTQYFTFTTPVKDVRAGGVLKDNKELLAANTEIFFMAKPESADAALGGELCLDDISLEEIASTTVAPQTATFIQVDQVGYGIGEKKAIVANGQANDSWNLYEATSAGSTVVLSGTLTGPGTLDSDTGDMTQSIDFSSVVGKPDATYAFIASRIKYSRVGWISIPQITLIISPSFKISSNQYSELKKDALSFFYAQRSTDDINMLKYPRYHAWMLTDRLAGHQTDLAKCWRVGSEAWNQTSDNWGNTFWTGCSWPTNTAVPGMDRLNTTTGQLNVTGGWYDAADHGKYVVNGGVALWTLQNQIERLQKRGKLNAAIPDGALKYPTNPAWIPQAGVIPTVKTDGVSDLLNEARYEMEWMLKMQVPGYTNSELTSKGLTASGNSTLMNLPIGYQTGKDVDNAVSAGPGRTDESTNITWPALKVSLTYTPNINVSGMAFHAVHDRYWTGVPQNPNAYNVFKPAVKNADGTIQTPEQQVPADEKRALMYPTTAATLNLAATAAQCYRVWKDADAVFAGKCLDAATRAFDAAKANSKIFRIEFSDARNLPLQAQFNGGGAYGDYRVKDEFYWAGVELYLAYLAKGDATAAAPYLTQATTRITGNGEDGVSASNTYVTCEGETGVTSIRTAPYPIRCYNWNSAFDWQNTAALGTLSLATVRPTGFAGQTSVDNNIKAAANTYLTEQRDLQGYLFPKAPTSLTTNQYGPLTDFPNDYKWGSNGTLLNRAIILGLAYDLTCATACDSKYLQGAADAMHYILGRNALGKSYVSGYGYNSLQNPHHRFWGKHGNVEYPSVQPGVMAGGPASGEFTGMFIGGANEGGDHFWYKTRGQPGCMALDAGKPATVTPTNTTLLTSMGLTKATTVNRYNGQRCYTDDIRSFATNEVALNWNAPLFWVTQFLDGSANGQ